MKLRKTAFMALTFSGCLLLVSCGSGIDTVGGIQPDPVPANAESNLAALWASGDFSVPVILSQKISTDLNCIRETFGEEIPAVEIEFRFPATPGELLVGLTEEAIQKIRNGSFAEFNSLNAEYDAVIDTSKTSWQRGFLKLRFSNDLNPYRLDDLYSNLDGIIYAEPNGLEGDGPCVYPWLKSDKITYLFRQAWGDCPAGCAHSDFWYFRDTESGLVYVGEWLSGNPEPSWWKEAKEGYERYATGGLTDSD